jgi:5-methylcytosine-specific restriction endonuclease McrA
MLAKPEPYQRVKARKKREQSKARRFARLDVLDRAEWRCQRCGVRVSDILPEWSSRRAHVNEQVPRSRGGSATDTANLEVLCQSCHLPNGMHAPTAERQAILTGRQKGKA